jgi:hypothetical protein
MSDGPRPEVVVFLNAFFSPPNQLTLTKDPRVQPWIDRVMTSDPQPSVLPCWRGGQVVDWYGLAFNERQYIALGENLMAFVGPTYATFRGQRAELDRGDPIDAAVQTLTGGLAYKFSGGPVAGAAAGVWRALERMRIVWARRPTHERIKLNAVGLLLRNFYMALQAGNEDEARACLISLREQRQLDSANSLFLQVQFLVAFGRYDEILRLPLLDDLLRIRRPVAVTQALIQAVYRVYLAPFEEADDPQGGARKFRAEIFALFSGLFASRSGMNAPEVQKSFMLLAVSLSPPSPELRDEILATAGLPAAEAGYLAKLAQLLPAPAPPPQENTLDRALSAIQASRFDEALSLARGLPPSVQRCRILRECALELQTLETRALAIEAVTSLPVEDQASFLQGPINQQLWAQIQGVAAEQPAAEGEAAPESPEPLPNDWCSWLQHLDEHDGKKGSRELARQGATEWQVSDLLDKPEELATFSTLLTATRSQAAERVLRDCLPHLLSFFQKDEAWPSPAFRDIYRLLLELLLCSLEGSQADLAFFNQLLDVLLSLAAADAAAYRELVTFGRDLWGKLDSPVLLDWLLDFLECLVIHPCTDKEARQACLQDALNAFQKHFRRVSADQQEVLKLLASDLGQPELFNQYFPESEGTQPDPASDPFALLAERSVAVYTLSESAGRQFQTVLERRCPKVRISLCHDRDASNRLKQLAKQADMFVMVTARAKHTAISAIEDNRPRSMPLLRPGGKGSASMLRALREHLAP